MRFATYPNLKLLLVCQTPKLFELSSKTIISKTYFELNQIVILMNTICMAIPTKLGIVGKVTSDRSFHCFHLYHLNINFKLQDHLVRKIVDTLKENRKWRLFSYYSCASLKDGGRWIYQLGQNSKGMFIIDQDLETMHVLYPIKLQRHIKSESCCFCFCELVLCNICVREIESWRERKEERRARACHD